MRHFAVLAMVVLGAAGCIGSSSGGSNSWTDQYDGRSGPPRTDLIITYTAPSCPPGVRCLRASDMQPYYLVSRVLTCSPAPANGNYPDPAAACRALTDIATKERQQELQPGPVTVCRCPMSRDAPKGVGYYHGHRRTIQLDPCSLCAVKDIGADLKVLLPPARI